MRLSALTIFLCLAFFWLLAPRLVLAASHGPVDYVEGDVLITFKPSASLADAQHALATHSLVLSRHFAELSRHLGRHCGLIHQSRRTTTALIAELSRDPRVERVETNYLRWVTSVPNDALFTNLWALSNQGQPVNGSAGTNGADIRFVPAWSLAQPTTNPVVVAVLDTGVDYTHPDLASNMWTNPGEIPGNGIDDDTNGYVDDYYGYDFADNLPDPMDSGFHGTHVAGIIAAVGNNQIGVIGVNYQAQIMALRVSSDGNSISTSAEIEALGYASLMKGNGVNLAAICAAFDGGGYSSAEMAAIQSAGDAGIIFCTTAGNNSSDNDTMAVYPANYRLTNMIVAAASDQNDELASFSDYGASTVDLVAPGVNILSLLPVSLVALESVVEQETNTYTANALIFSGTTTGITASVYDCGFGNPEEFPAAVSNNIALIQRGTLQFSDKVSNAMAAGAIAALIYNNSDGNYLGSLLTSNNWIPTLALAQADGQALLASLPACATVINTPDPAAIYQYLDGTSMAAAQVAGAVAFAAQNFPAETVTQRVQRILANVDVLPGLAGQVQTGGRLNLQRIVDTDQNGLPDWWEMQYFGQLTGANTNADPDQDGMSNLAEWLAGTNPTNAASVLTLNLVGVTVTNTAVLDWPSVAGKVYQLECTTDLLASPFWPIITNIAATAPINCVADTNVNPAATLFYRVGVVPQ